MSILDEIREHVHSGSLFEVTRRDLRATEFGYRRWVYVSPSINQECATRVNEASFRQLSDQLQNFIMGRTIPVALGQDHKDAEWARLYPPGREVWEARVRYQRPELRVIGRIANVDIFVALHLYDSQIKGKRNWDRVQARCEADWAVLFPYTSPVVGSAINDYISTNVTLI